ncbi:LRR receptor-like serine threonine-protein kinase [Seminavis robusta]|uniref:LRR receptor-like serine threonine-protein kinase n=1 Tax=Seminavis robusta TaxID=568900 RepID=A0A9N8DZA6_9STRA|nr:LRR receptor-like serine threonine-protein kinase [Seminavis robusta]|eukprot:Sro360_g126250.1 LRR receptor-like serine threonine-protein kinase (730) ;mRNA; f:39983-42172
MPVCLIPERVAKLAPPEAGHTQVTLPPAAHNTKRAVNIPSSERHKPATQNGVRNVDSVDVHDVVLPSRMRMHNNEIDVDEFIQFTNHDGTGNTNTQAEAKPGAIRHRGPEYQGPGGDFSAFFSGLSQESDDGERNPNPFASDEINGFGIHASGNLVEATAVEESSTEFVVTQEATHIDDLEPQKQRMKKNEHENKTKIQLALLALLTTILVVVVVAVVAIAANDTHAYSINGTVPIGIVDSDDYDVYPLIRPYLSNVTRHAIERELAVGVNASSASSHQYRAYQWLQADPWKQNYTAARLVQRFALVTLYYATNGENWINNGVGGMQEVEHREFDTPRLRAMLAGGPPAKPPPPQNDSGGPPNNNGDGAPTAGSLPPNAAGGPPPGGSGGGPPPNGAVGGPPSSGAGGSPPPTVVEPSASSSEMIPPVESNKGRNSTRHLQRELQSTDSITLTVPSEKWLSYDTSECFWFTYTPFRFQTACNDENMFQYLDLRQNGLAGRVPEEVGLLTGLQSINLYRNQHIQGPIPTTIGRLRQLQTISLTDNQLTGTLPSDLGLLTNVIGLSVLNNQLHGTLPTELLQMSNLVNLLADRNDLTGTFFSPDVICQSWPNLQVVMLGWNKMEGPLPSFANCSSLGAIHLDNQGFTGTIAAEWGHLTKLQRIIVYGNEGILGPVPSTLGQLANLTDFKVTGTGINGTIPEALCAHKLEGVVPVAKFDCSAQLCGCDCPCN